MNQLSCFATLIAFFLAPQNKYKKDSPLTESFVVPDVPEFTGSPLSSEPVLNPDLLIVNRWETVTIAAPPDFSPLSLLAPMAATALPADWNSISKVSVPWWLLELRVPRGDEAPADWPPRRKEYRERYVVIADSRVTVERPNRVSWQTHDVPALNSGQVKFVRGRAVAV